MVYCSAKLVASSTISNPRADKVTLGDDKPTMTFEKLLMCALPIL